jgi:hypothetical protein
VATVFVVLVVAGCGTAAPPHRSAARELPRQLAREWAAQASAIAVAATAGNSCRALRLADSLRGEVVAAGSELPSRFRSPLLIGVNALTSRLACAPPAVTAQPPPPPAPQSHGHHGNGNGNGNGNGDNNGGGGENNGGSE